MSLGLRFREIGDGGVRPHSKHIKIRTAGGVAVQLSVGGLNWDRTIPGTVEDYSVRSVSYQQRRSVFSQNEFCRPQKSSKGYVHF